MDIDIKKLQKTSVSQLHNKNQFILKYNNCGDPCFSVYCFQSYATLIAIYVKEENKLYINWSMFDYSKTTLKHLKMFVNEYTPYTYENKQQFINLINSGKVKTFANE